MNVDLPGVSAEVALDFTPPSLDLTKRLPYSPGDGGIAVDSVASLDALAPTCSNWPIRALIVSACRDCGSLDR
jgi:hypothetical protein